MYDDTLRMCAFMCAFLIHYIGPNDWIYFLKSH